MHSIYCIFFNTTIKKKKKNYIVVSHLRIPSIVSWIQSRKWDTHFLLKYVVLFVGSTIQIMFRYISLFVRATSLKLTCHRFLLRIHVVHDF